jgi:hypothetical protein
MKLRFSPQVFAAAFALTYAVVFAFDRPMFRYYPLHGDFNWGNAVIKNAGPAMSWYGFMADSAVVALIAAVIIPGALADRALRNRVWPIVAAVMLLVVYLLRVFFVGHALG